MEDRTETVEDWELPEVPTEVEQLRQEVRTLQIYTKTVSQNYANTWKEIVRLRKILTNLGVEKS